MDPTAAPTAVPTVVPTAIPTDSTSAVREKLTQLQIQRSNLLDSFQIHQQQVQFHQQMLVQIHQQILKLRTEFKEDLVLWIQETANSPNTPNTPNTQSIPNTPSTQ